MFVKKSTVKRELETMLRIANTKDVEEKKVIEATCMFIAGNLNIPIFR